MQALLIGVTSTTVDTIKLERVPPSVPTLRRTIEEIKTSIIETKEELEQS